MIYDRIENIETYTAISERLAKGLRLLRTTDFSAMEAGKYEVDGTELYYMLQCYQSKEQNDKPEAHKSILIFNISLRVRNRSELAHSPEWQKKSVQIRKGISGSIMGL